MLKQFAKLFGRGEDPSRAEDLYQSVMSAALAPALYEAKWLNDTFDGRFESVTLHSALVMRHLRAFDEPGRTLADALYRQVFNGFDHALRERGAGDSSIARKIRALGERFFGLARAVDGALDEDAPQESIQSVLIRNGIGGEASAAAAAYLLELDTHLQALTLEQFETASIDWPTA